MQKATRYLLIVITAFFLVATIVKAYTLSTKFGGTDLRCRIVGARLLATNHSPYFYKWNPADGEYYLDPNDHAPRLVNGNVVTPAALYVIYPISLLPYATIRTLWTVLHFIAAMIFLLLLLPKQPPSRRFLTGFIIINGLICSNTLLTGIERGQMYMFYALAFAVIYWLYISKLRYNEWISGFVAGLFILFRPFAAMMGLAFLLQRKIKWLLGCIAGFIVGACLFILPNTSLWKDYFRAMQEYSNESSRHGHFDTTKIEPVKPAVIEGMVTINRYGTIESGGLAAIYGYLSDWGIHINNNQSYLAYTVVLLVLSAFFFRIRNKGPDPDTLFLFAFLVYILAEIFTVVPRAHYNVIQWIFPLTLICRKIRLSSPLFIIFILSLLLLHGFPFTFRYQGELAELGFIGITLYSIFFQDSFKKPAHGSS